MKKILKWVGIGLGSLIAAVIIAITALFALGNARISKAEVETKLVVVPDTANSSARGEHLIRYVSACVSCHGSDLSGEILVDEPMVGVIAAPNLTTGAGGIGAIYTDEEFARAIRHGVGSDGRVLGGMPSNQYAYLSDEDTGAIIAYLRSLPPVDHSLPSRSLTLAGTVLFGGLGFNTLPYAIIDHDGVGSTTPVEAVSVEYGEYLINIASCADCHGADLAGRSPESSQPGPPAGPNLTASGSVGGWSAEEFMTVMRAGRTPDGRQLSQEMPWRYYAGTTDGELEAIYLYLQQLK